MADLKLHYIAWRDGRPRFIPSPEDRALGFKGEDLRHGAHGAWFSFEEARIWCYGTDGNGGRYGAIIKARAGGKPLVLPTPRGRTVEDLMVDWLHALTRGTGAAKPGATLSLDTIESYRKAADAVVYKPETREQRAARIARERAHETLGQTPTARAREPFSRAPVSAIGTPELTAFFSYLKDERGHHAALAAISALSAAWTFGQKSTFWRLPANPRHAIEFERPAGRIVVWEVHELAAMLAAADALGRPSIGDAFLLGVDMGQRQRDRLLMTDEGLFDGRRRFRQSKTGMVVEIRETPRLAQRLAEARSRVAALKLKLGLRDLPETIVVDETTGRAYDSTTYRHVVADVRALAIRGSNEHGLAPCQSIAFVNEAGEPDMKHDQDLRDTCVTRLYRAGCSLLEICDITGHTYKSVQTIVNHYLARDRGRADVAIDKLIAFMDAKEAKG